MQGTQQDKAQFCQKCGRPIEPDSLFCRFCGTATAITTPEPQKESRSPSKSTAPRKRRRKIVWALVAAVVIVIAIVLGLFYLPIPHSFSASIFVPSGHLGEANLTFPTGVGVSGSWHTSSGASVAWFDILTTQGGTIYQGSGVSGSFSFTAIYSTYSFEAGGGPATVTVLVSGSYSQSIV